MSRLTQESVSRTIVRMAVPMLAGSFAMNMYQLTNTWFVSRLGTEALAAMSFTYPVVMFIMLVIRGVGAGAMTLVAHAIGRRDRTGASTLLSHTLLLGLFSGLLIALFGLLTMGTIFSRLGASGAVLGLTGRYMRVWFLGAMVMATQLLASDVIISTGNTRVISLLMVGGTVVNALLDLLLIFGHLGLPRMGITGAALATLIAQSLTLAGALYILHRRMGLIDFHGLAVQPVLASWGRIMRFGIPGALGMILSPISAAVIVRMVSRHGTAAVAAIGIATRIEMFAFMIPMTVGMSLIPFVAQNFGAERLDRIRAARKGAMVFALLYGIFIASVFCAAIGPIARFFSEAPEVIKVLRSYITITCFGYGFLEVHRYAGFLMTGIQEPIKATVLDFIRILALMIPLALLGHALFGLTGIFWGRFATDICAGLIGILWSGWQLAAQAGKMPRASVPTGLDAGV
jgi:putative MATE family efflux protein